jgi:hypothetical protein
VAGLVWRAHRGAFAGQLAVSVLAGLVPVAAAWLLRSILDQLAGGHPSDHRLLVAVVLLAVAGGLQAVLPNVGAYLTAQSGRAGQRLTTSELFTAVSWLACAGLRIPGFTTGSTSRSGTQAPCACFGGSRAQPLGVTHLVRNCCMLAVLTVALAGALADPGHLAPGAAALAAATGLVAGLLIARWDDLPSLFAPVPAARLAPHGEPSAAHRDQAAD